MSKELEALKRIGKFHIEKTSSDKGFEIADTIDFDIIEKSLKALEIIKKKRVNLFLFSFCIKKEEYNSEVSKERRLTQTEYDILKEILLWN